MTKLCCLLNVDHIENYCKWGSGEGGRLFIDQTFIAGPRKTRMNGLDGENLQICRKRIGGREKLYYSMKSLAYT